MLATNANKFRLKQKIYKFHLVALAYLSFVDRPIKYDFGSGTHLESFKLRIYILVSSLKVRYRGNPSGRGVKRPTNTAPKLQWGVALELQNLLVNYTAIQSLAKPRV